MRGPQDKVPQRRLVYQLALQIDLCIAADTVSPGSARLRRAALGVMIAENPRSTYSTHVLHNIGARRARWLLAARDAGALPAPADPRFVSTPGNPGLWETANGGPPPPNKPGAPFTPRETCARGHSMADAYIKPNQDRQCRECRDARDHGRQR